MIEKKKILLVEDEALIALDIQSQLKTLGYEPVGIAASSAKALLLAEQKEPDLVLMDIKIKGDRDGIETATALKSKFDLPIVFLTAYSDESFLERAKQAEPFGYLLKPVETRELHSTVEMALYKDEVEKERKELTQNLEAALREVRTLRGCLPICAFCKKIRDDSGGWHQIESYIRSKSEAEFSHTVCPNCAEKEYPYLDVDTK